MQPTLAAAEVRRNITQYLSTTFALADEPVREGLESFFNDPAQGIFLGPYLRVRTPFRKSDDSWRQALEWHPADFTPFLHQAKAFQRLSSLTRPPNPRSSPPAPVPVRPSPSSSRSWTTAAVPAPPASAASRRSCSTP